MGGGGLRWVVVGGGSRWWWVVVGGGGGGWWLYMTRMKNVYKVERDKNIDNHRVPGAAGGSKKSGPAISDDTFRGGRKGDPQH